MLHHRRKRLERRDPEHVLPGLAEGGGRRHLAPSRRNLEPPLRKVDGDRPLVLEPEKEEVTLRGGKRLEPHAQRQGLTHPHGERTQGYAGSTSPPRARRVEVPAGGGEVTTTATFSEPGEYMLRVTALETLSSMVQHCCYTNNYVKVTVTP